MNRPRHFADLAEGLIRACGHHFGQHIALRARACRPPTAAAYVSPSPAMSTAPEQHPAAQTTA